MTYDPSTSPCIGVVAIGRNEGARLEACLRSAVEHASAVVYVDSGSTDDSRAVARRLGAEVVELDLAIPFTAARARNAGFRRLLELYPGLEFVQFVDGDCELRPDWLPQAAAALRDDPGLAVVCGRRRERRPEASVYNRLCDLEWDTPIGEARACGGDALMRVAALAEAAGFDDRLIAGEEPELCVRLRRNGWRLRRLDVEMTLHDADLTRFKQWWRRSTRAGHAFAEGAALHGAPPERHWVRETRSNWLWGLLLPAASLVAAPFTSGASLAVAAGLYALLAYRVRRHQLRRGRTRREAALYAAFTTLGKFPQALGQCRFLWNRRRGKRSRLIEYKEVPA